MFLGGWVGGWMGGSKSRFKDCLQQSKMVRTYLKYFELVISMDGLMDPFIWLVQK
jgi:hypothetical protein